VRVSQGEFWTVSDVALVVERWYGVKYQCRDSYVRLLHECQFSQQQTERVYRSQPDPPAVAEFEAQLEKK
jgi:transposase